MTISTMVYAYTKSESRRNPVPRSKLPPLFDEVVTFKNWYKFINWIHVVTLLGTPLIALYGMATTSLQTNTLIWSLAYFYISAIGTTVGLHRFFSHHSFSASTPLKIFLLLAGSASVEGSAVWWSRGHRAHHRWTDTDKDPYSAHRGIFYSHFGWMLISRPKNKIGSADVADLKADPIIRFQHDYYFWFAIFFGFIFPTLVAGIGWGDYKGGYIYAAIVRLCVVQHSTFFINSLAHYLGEDTFDDYHSPRDHWLTAFLTFGEGYHNYHHQFPQDYRGAIYWYQYDPAKWFIRTCVFLGLASDPKTFPTNEVNKGIIQMKEKKLMAERRQLKFGTPIEDLAIYTWHEYQELVLNENKKWILIDGILYDVCEFMHEHPGGVKFITTAIGKDMTSAFNGAIYNHSNAARNVLTNFRCGVLQNGMKVMHEEALDELEYKDKGL